MKAKTAQHPNPTTAYTIVLEPSRDGDDVWTAEIPAFGIVTEGHGSDGARKAALDAIEGYIEVATRLGKPIPSGDILTTPRVAWSAAPPAQSRRGRTG